MSTPLLATFPRGPPKESVRENSLTSSEGRIPPAFRGHDGCPRVALLSEHSSLDSPTA
ncbi:hypothetical protein [Rhodococcus sp. H29-C3]|uniref:hypothetical protein n=1 Tax=Rhodococcus sp. H29-C3 TaxID=3046307 RepID=UPI0024B956BD|nr:hypothetical protein [Rhodococcus sp. H29-C3]MDJ0361656.1 hypothetical protein [Rhodococcus sp. H29-C3]